MILARTSKPTLTPFGLNHNDTLRFTCRDGRGWDMTLLATSAAVLEREHAARRGYQDKGHDSGDISAYAFECDLRINGREEKRPVRVNPVSRKYGRSGSARPAPKQGAPAGLSGEAAWAKSDPRPRASGRDGPEHPAAVPEVPRHCPLPWIAPHSCRNIEPKAAFCGSYGLALPSEQCLTTLGFRSTLRPPNLRTVAPRAKAEG